MSISFSETLFKYDSKGKVREWTVEVIDDGYRTIAGLQDGKQVVSELTKCLTKNVGKKNETSGAEQAIKEAQALVAKKLDRFYVSDISQLESTKDAFKPMLARTFKGWLKDWDNIEVFSQPKLDGIRCLTKTDGSRSRVSKPIITCSHINDELDEIGIFKHHSNIVLDGELYNHAFKEDFQTLVSYIKKKRPETVEHVQYHIYDIYDPDRPDMTFSERFEFLRKWLSCLGSNSSIMLVSTTLVTSLAELDLTYTGYLKLGYEGGIVRPNFPYEMTRSKGLWKRKDFEDKEFKVKRIEAGKGNWTGLAKRVIYENDDDTGNEFGTSLKGNMKHAKDIMDNHLNYVDGGGTVRFFGRTDDNLPRIGVTVNLTKKNEKRL